MSKPVCELCGKPMPAGEEMFKYHGYSGPCPAPPKPNHKREDLKNRIANTIWQAQPDNKSSLEEALETAETILQMFEAES